MDERLFDGRAFAKTREDRLRAQILRLGVTPRIASVVFKEDAGSMLYIKLKKQAAVRVGIEFSTEELSLAENLETIVKHVEIYSSREDVHGVMVQKPMKESWAYTNGKGEGKFEYWWQRIVGAIDPKKDVDCLTKISLDKVYSREWKLLPATVKAVVSILNEGAGMGGETPDRFDLSGVKTVVVGRSDIVGKPLAEVLGQYGAQVRLFGSDLDREVLAAADVVVSATGQPGLITGDMVREGVVAIDVGAPSGDFEFESVAPKAGFITPVPGGVGPVTVVSLLENLVELMVG